MIYIPFQIQVLQTAMWGTLCYVSSTGYHIVLAPSHLEGKESVFSLLKLLHKSTKAFRHNTGDSALGYCTATG